MNSLTFLDTPTNSILRDMDKSILVSVIHDEINQGSYFIVTASNGNDIELSVHSWMPGTIKKTFGLNSEQFITYIN